jgi:uncharacterized membrane protein YsdA (DUF1294 family)
MLPDLIETNHPSLLWLGFGLCLMGVNLMTYAAFRLDKERARTGGWRVSERGLLLLAASGGWPAAKFAQHQLHHKLRKRSFATRLNVVGTGLGLAFLVGLTPLGAVLVA